MTGGNPFSYAALLQQTEKQLEPLGEDSKKEAWMLFSKASGLTKSGYYMNRAEPVKSGQWELLQIYVKRRLNHEPLQYILGEWEFYSLPFSVRKGVLIPRPETELLVDTVLQRISDYISPKVLDLCCGSGCIAVSLAKSRPDADITAIDFYDEPLECSKENAMKNGVNVKVKKEDVLSHPPFKYLASYDVVAANPPYVRENMLRDLQEEVKKEPAEALNGGKDGLIFYRSILSRWKAVLRAGGILAVEIGYDQAEQVKSLFEVNGFENICLLKDLNGNDRLVMGNKL